MAGNTSTPGATVVSRALSLLFAFDETHRRLTLTELAERADLPVPTAYRLAGELVAGGALTRRPSGEYVVGRRLWDLGLLAPLQTGLRQVAAPFLTDVHAATRATVHLAIRDGTSVLYLERFSGRLSVPIVSRVGSRLPLHATGVGKVLLAHAPESVQAAALAELTRITPYTITAPARLLAQLERVRRDGYATTVEEMTLGACSLAVPIRPALNSSGFDSVTAGSLPPPSATRGSSARGSSAPGASSTGSVAREAPVVASVGVVVSSLKRDRTRLLTALQVAANGIGRMLPG